MDLQSIYQIASRHKWAFAVSTVLTVGVALFVYSLLPTYYEAVATMMPSERVMLHPTSVGASSMPVGLEQKDERVATLAAMAESRTICAMASDRLDRSLSASDIQSRLKVQRVVDMQAGTKTNLLQVKIASETPEQAVTTANAVAESFCKFYDNVSHREATENRKFLKEQLDTARQKLDTAEDRLRQFRGSEHITSLQTQIDSALNVLSGLKSDRDTAAARLYEISGNLSTVSRQLSGMSSSKRTVEMTSEGSTAADLRTKIADMEKELASLRSRYTPKHPKIVQLETQLARAREELNRAPDRMVEKVVVAPDPQYEALAAKKRDLEAERDAQAAKLEALDRAIGTREGELLAYSETDVDLSRRLLDHKTAQEAYSAVLALYNQARMDEILTTETGAIEVIDLADKALGPFRKGPNAAQLLMASVLLGVALGMGYAVATERFDASIRTIDDARALIDLPIVGVVPQLPSKSTNDDVARLTFADPVSPHAESYRFLSTDLLLTASQQGVRSIMVATAKPHQGGTVTICNLAISLAQAGKSVILIDGDLRRPMLHRVFGVDNSPGLSNVLSNGTHFSSALHPTCVDNLRLLPAGSSPDNPWKLLRSQRFAQLIDQLKDESDFVLLDSPSAMVFADAITMSTVVDGVIVVIRANQPPRGNELQLKHLLNKANVNILGIVLNAVSPQLTDSICFHDYYYSSEDHPNGLALRGSSTSEDPNREERGATEESG